MNIQYPVSEILRCVDYINDPKKEIYESSNEILVLNNSLTMKKETKETKKTKLQVLKEDDVLPETEKIIKEAESTIPQTSLESSAVRPFQIEEITKVDDLKVEKKEIKEIKELESSTAQPFQIEEITKVDDLKVDKKETAEDILMLSEEVSDEYSSKKKNSNKQDLEEIKKLNEQVSVLKTHNAMIERDLSEIFKTINHKSAEKELQARLELVYEQQRVIKDYENQILNLKNQNEFLENKFYSQPKKIIPDLKHDDKSNIDSKKTPQLISQEKYDEELKIKYKIIHEQQSILGDYQDQVSKLKEENRLLQKNIEINNSKLIAATQIQRENNDNDTKMQDMIGKIKYYQEDNLRLSNEVVILSNKLENTKQQLKQFEDNKAKLMHQMQNLNNIISENNIIDSPFGTSTQKNEYKPETDEKTSDDKKQIVQNKFENLTPDQKIDNEEMNRKVNKIFSK